MLQDCGLIAIVGAVVGFTLGRAGRGGLIDWIAAGIALVIFWRAWGRVKARHLARARERR